MAFRGAFAAAFRAAFGLGDEGGDEPTPGPTPEPVNALLVDDGAGGLQALLVAEGPLIVN